MVWYNGRKVGFHMKHKCLCSILLILTMLSTCWTYSVAEEMSDAFTSGDYEYIILDDGTVKITKYNGSAQELAIPDTLDGKKVTSIGNRAFSACRSLTSIFISDSVSQLDKLAFFGCRFLRQYRTIRRQRIVRYCLNFPSFFPRIINLQRSTRCPFH